MQIFSTKTNKPHAYQFGEYQNQLAFNPVEIAISSDAKTWQSCFDIEDLSNIYLMEFDWLSPVKGDTYSALGTRNGQVLTSSRYDQRDLTLNFYAMLRDEVDQKLAVKAITDYFASSQPYWITFDNAGYRMYQVMFKSMTPTYIGDKYMTISVVLNNLTGVSQSVVSSLNLQNEMAYGLGFDGLQSMNYSFNSNSFTVYNAGDIEIDPVIQNDYLILTIKAQGKPSITNTDTGDVFTFNNDTDTSHVITLNGVNPFLDGKNCGSQTNNGFIRLKQGDNHFTVSGCSDISISFDFYFKYLN